MPPRKKVAYVGKNFGLKIPLVVRMEWKALRGRKKWMLWTPIPYVRLSYTGSDECHGLRGCAEILQKLQKFHMDKKKGDIPWNFLINTEGTVYQGRGWYTEPYIPENLQWLKGNLIDIAFIGNYEFKEPPWVMLDRAMEVIEYGVLTGILAPNFKIIPYREKCIPQEELEL